MSRFIESIKVESGKVHHLAWHQQRVNAAFAVHFPDLAVFDLEAYIGQVEFPMGKAKLRIVYDGQTAKHTIDPYAPKPVASLQIVPALIEYDHKYEDRSRLEKLFGLRHEADDILILCNNEITDTYYANIALLKNGEWFTPKSYLLNGVKRQVLLSEGAINETTVTLDDLEGYEAISLINAMLDLGEITVPIGKVIF